MTYRRLTPQEIEDLRAEMRAAGEWCKAELARRRLEHNRVETAENDAQHPDPFSADVGLSHPGENEGQ